MATDSIFRRAWLVFTKPREPIVQALIRRYRRRQFALLSPNAPRNDRYYDLAIREYLALWRESNSAAELYQMAALRLGLGEYDAPFIAQVLCSAAYGTLPNWANCHDNPWWQAAWRFTQSIDRYLLQQLHWELSGQASRRARKTVDQQS
jgi:hypothetical protein